MGNCCGPELDIRLIERRDRADPAGDLHPCYHRLADRVSIHAAAAPSSYHAARKKKPANPKTGGQVKT